MGICGIRKVLHLTLRNGDKWNRSFPKYPKIIRKADHSNENSGRIIKFRTKIPGIKRNFRKFGYTSRGWF